MSLRSVWAIFAGVLFTIIVTVIVDEIFHKLGFYPPTGQGLSNFQAVVATAYRIVITIAGAYLTASLAPGAPMKHALILGVVGTILGFAGVVATWGKNLGPTWYPIALMVLAVPQCWVGGKIYESRWAVSA